MNSHHLLRWILLRIPILRGVFVILFLIYTVLPVESPGQNVLSYIALGYLSGAAIIAIPAFGIFVLFMIPIALLADKERHRNNAIDDSQYVLMTNLTGLGGIILLAFYLSNFKNELPWAVWLTSLVSIGEILLFVCQGRVASKKEFYKAKLLSSVALYGMGIFYLIATDGDFRSPELNHRPFYILIICHMVVEVLIFKFISQRSLQKITI